MDLGIAGLSEGTEIGVGASAVVYRATQVDLDRQVAVKVLTTTDPAFVRRFEREAKTLGKLSRNSGIVTVYDTGVNASGQPYLLLELCDSSLLDRLQQDDTVDPYEACGIMAEVAEAVADAHEAGVVHRDIKPANVLVSSDRRHMVSDFGISTTTSSTTGQTSSVGFTAGYVAPETLSGGETESPADVYSMGATLFHLVAGRAPFVDTEGNANLLALVNRITNDPIPDLRDDGVPESVCAAIEAAMDKDPTTRPTAAEFRARLLTITAGGGASEGIEPDGPPTPGATTDGIGGEVAADARAAEVIASPPADPVEANGDDATDGRDGKTAVPAVAASGAALGAVAALAGSGPEPGPGSEPGSTPAGSDTVVADAVASDTVVSDTVVSDTVVSDTVVADTAGADTVVADAADAADAAGAAGADTVVGVVNPEAPSPRSGPEPIAPPVLPTRSGGAGSAASGSGAGGVVLADAPAGPPPGGAGGSDTGERRLSLLPDRRLPAGLLLGGGALLVLALVAAGVWFGNRESDDGDSNAVAAEAAGPEITAAEETDASVPEGNALSEGYDPSGTPELRSNLDSLTQRLAIPDAVGIREAAAVEALEDEGFRVNIVYQESSQVSGGRVISQDPSAGERAPVGSLVTLFISRTNVDPTVTIPAVADDTVAAATAKLEDRGLVVAEEPVTIYHDVVAADAVVGTEPPASTAVNRGATVTLFVSLGRPTVPDLAGTTRAEATDLLAGRTLTATFVDVEAVGAIGTVASTDPAAGVAVDTGTEITVSIIATNPPPPDCPTASLAGRTEAEARAAVLAVENCTVASPVVTETSATVPEGVVIRATATGREVTLVVSDGPPVDCAPVAAGLTGMTRAAAVTAVADAGCTLGTDGDPENSEVVAAGLVARAELLGGDISLIMSLGPATCTLPNVAGKTVQEAIGDITAVCDGRILRNGAPPTGTVVSTDPAPGEIPLSATITLVVQVAVPNVIDMAPAAATTALEGQGLRATVEQVEVPAGDPRIGKVFAQTPAAGATALVGSSVTIRVGVEEPPPTTDTTTRSGDRVDPNP